MNAVFNCDKLNDDQLNKILVLFYFYEQLNNKQNRTINTFKGYEWMEMVRLLTETGLQVSPT